MFSENKDEKIGYILSRYKFGHDYKHLSKNKSKKFCYPCINFINKKGTTFMYSCRDTKDHKIPKVITSQSGEAYSYFDINGEYGLTDNSRGFVADKDTLFLIFKAVNTNKWKKLHPYLKGT